MLRKRKWAFRKLIKMGFVVFLMVMGNVTDLPVGLIGEIGQIALWLQTIGIVIIAWIIFQIVNLIINRKRIRMIDGFSEDIKRIERKIDTLSNKLDKKK